MRTGSFITDAQRAEKQLRSLKKQSQDFSLAFQVALGGLAAGAITELVSQLTRLPGAFSDLVRSAGDFQDIGEQLGTSAEGLAGFSIALGTTNTQIQTLADFSTKLTKNLSQVDDESDKVAKALSAIGISFRDFQRLNPVERVEALSKALASFPAGSEQAAVLEAIARGGSQLLPFLKELEASGGRQTTLTAEQIRLADEFADRQARAAAQLRVTAQVIAINLTPALSDLTDAAKETLRAFFGLEESGGKLAGDNEVQQFADKAADALAFLVDAGTNVIRIFESIGKAIGATAAQAAAILTGEFREAARIGEIARDDIERLLTSDNFSDRLQRARAARRSGDANRRAEDRGFDPRKRIDISGLADSGSGSKDDPAKKLLDNQIKALEQVIKRETDLLSERNRFLEFYNDQGLLSIRAYYETQQAIIDAATSAQIAAYDKQLDALETARQAATKQTDVADLTGKIDEVIEKRARLEQDAGAKSLALTFKRQEAEKRYAEQIEATRASVLELQGNLGAAAAIRFDQQNAKLFQQAIAEGDVAAQALLRTLRAATIAQADFAKARSDAQLINDALANQEDRIALSRQLGATTELGSLKKLGEARQAAVTQLEAMVVAQEAIAKASGNPELVLQAERARIGLEQLRAAADPLAQKFDTIFKDSFTDAFTGLIDGTKSAKDAFNDFAASLSAAISRIAAQNLAEAIFGAGGNQSGAGFFGSFFSSIFGGAKAGGGDVIAGRSYMVGERGPERFVPRTAGTIVPASSTQNNNRTINAPINISVQGQVDRRTQTQIGAEVRRALQTAGRNL